MKQQIQVVQKNATNAENKNTNSGSSNTTPDPDEPTE